LHKIREIIVVEGKCDKSAVLAAVDATVVETKGFGVFKDKDKLRLLRKMAENRGIVILTDSDSAGFLIRSHLKGGLNGIEIKNAYIPDIPGKERRKAQPSKEGKLGVEAMSAEIIIEALRRGGATFEDEGAGNENSNPITKAELFELGLTGCPGSGEKRAALLKALELPENMTAKALLEALNTMMTREELIETCSKLF
jgi:ribonuclease M5